ncbi:MAG: RsmD family RNA methyltransferase [Planctomycetota bacterium]|jgi:16S rRNA (guanine966-N2)-methyltransferase
MRIIAGEWRGRRLEVPDGIRPMLDRERERLFGVIGERIEDAAFLDCFSGSGAIGLEAVSRGARLATLVENGRKVLPVLRRNIEALGAGDRVRLLPISALGLHKAGEPGQGAVDIGSAAPPFPMLLDDVLRVRLETLFTYIALRLVKAGGIFVLEHPKELATDGLCGLGEPHDLRVTAASALSFWETPA